MSSASASCRRARQAFPILQPFTACKTGLLLAQIVPRPHDSTTPRQRAHRMQARGSSCQPASQRATSRQWNASPFGPGQRSDGRDNEAQPCPSALDLPNRAPFGRGADGVLGCNGDRPAPSSGAPSTAASSSSRPAAHAATRVTRGPQMQAGRSQLAQPNSVTSCAEIVSGARPSARTV